MMLSSPLLDGLCPSQQEEDRKEDPHLPLELPFPGDGTFAYAYYHWRETCHGITYILCKEKQTLKPD